MSNEKNWSNSGTDLPSTEAELFELEQFPVFNTDEVLATILLNVPNNKEILRSILQLLADELPKNLADIESAHNNNDWENIEKIAHKMKGSALNCGSVKMRYACQYLERYKKAGHLVHLERLYRQLLKVVHETKQALNQLLS